MKITEIDNTGIKKSNSNGARTQTILMNCENNMFKIHINSESYDVQSFARLYVMGNNKKWENIKTIKPKRDYGIDLSYQDNYSSNSFDPIIDDFQKIIEKIVPTLQNNNNDNEDLRNELILKDTKISQAKALVTKKIDEAIELNQKIEELKKEIEMKDIKLSQAQALITKKIDEVIELNETIVAKDLLINDLKKSSSTNETIDELLNEIKNVEIASPDFSKSKKSIDTDTDDNKSSKTKRNRQ